VVCSGGFAHVYVVRTANPINNTFQHVLKRIAVADRNMLAEVQKEVDVMVHITLCIVPSIG
jgi:AP2-associated kinase